MRARALPSVIAFAGVIALAYGYFSSMGVHLKPPEGRIHLSMSVANINGLVVGSSVQLRGVPIGEVTSISTGLDDATVSFYLDAKYEIPVDSDIRLENLSALGEAYIGLLPESDEGPYFENGQHIAVTSVTQPPSVSELATSVVRVLNQLEPAALSRIIDEVDLALPSPTTVLPNLSRTTTLLRNLTTSMDGKGRGLLDNFQTLFRNAQFVGPVMAHNTPYITAILRRLEILNNCTIVLDRDFGGAQAIHNLARFVLRTEHLMDHSSGDIRVLTQTMLPYMNELSGALMNLDSGRVLSNLLAAVPEDGAVTLHLTIPDTTATSAYSLPEPLPAPAAAPQTAPHVGAPTRPPSGPPLEPPTPPLCKAAFPDVPSDVAEPAGR